MIEPRLRGTPEPSHPNLRALIEERVAGLGEAPFLIRPETGETFSYAELGRRVGATARALAGLGVGQGDRVSLLLFNGPDFVWPYFAIWTLGAVACPINTGLKGEEIGYVVDHAEASVLIVDRRLLPEVEGIRADLPHLRRVVVVDVAPGGGAATGAAGDVPAAAGRRRRGTCRLGSSSLLPSSPRPSPPSRPRRAGSASTTRPRSSTRRGRPGSRRVSS